MADHLNAQPHPKAKEALAHVQAVGGQVWVAQTALGPPVKDVKQRSRARSQPIIPIGCIHNTTTVLHTVQFRVTFKAGSPLHDQVQNFSFPGGYEGSITTPFGVPLWGGDPILGPAVLHVTPNHGPTYTYDFTVVA